MVIEDGNSQPPRRNHNKETRIRIGNQPFGRLIKILREQNDLTQKQLNEAVKKIHPNIAENTITKLEQGREGSGLRAISNVVGALSSVFGYEGDDLESKARRAAFYDVAGISNPDKWETRQNTIVKWFSSKQPLSGVASRYVFDDEVNGIRWRETLPDFLSPEQLTSIIYGIKVFRAIVVRNLSTQEVLRTLGSNALSLEGLRGAVKAALRIGALRILSVATDHNLKQALISVFPQLRENAVYVVGAPTYDSDLIGAEFVAALTAMQVLPTLEKSTGIGFGGGFTSYRTAELSIPSIDKFAGTKWVPLMQAQSKYGNHLAANHVVQTLVNRHPKSSALYFPFIHQTPSLPAQEMYEQIVRTKIEHVFLSVNGFGKEDSKPASSLFYADGSNPSDAELNLSGLLGDNVNEFAGEYLGLLLNSKGQPLPLDPKFRGADNMVYPDLPPLFKAEILDKMNSIVQGGTVWIVAARKYKANAIYTALRYGLCNGLVIDRQIAQSLLELSHQENRA